MMMLVGIMNMRLWEAADVVSGGMRVGSGWQFANRQRFFLIRWKEACK